MPDLMRIPSKTAIIRLDGVSTNALTHPNGARTTSSPSLTDECHDTRNKRWVRPLASMNCKNGSLSVHLFIPSVQSRAPNDNVIHKLIAIILITISDMNIHSFIIGSPGPVREAVILGRLRLPLVVDDVAGRFAVGGIREDRERPFP